MSIARLPPVLAMHVKRFEAGGTHSQVKLWTHGEVKDINHAAAAGALVQCLLLQPMRCNCLVLVHTQ
jgi:hypothetical protein